ncbi:MAG: rhodanese-related sulfurtransferase [Chlamydiales bacterium]
MKYLALAYYKFISIDDPHIEVLKHKKFFENKDVTTRIYISEEGISGQMSGCINDAQDYMDWLKTHSYFSDMVFKIHPISENIFPRVTVKYRKQLVAFDAQVNLTKGGQHVAPREWKKMVESGEYFLLDVRNNYEWAIGHFQGAMLPPIRTFREFPKYAQELSKAVDPLKTKVMMYCTGGIRCELYSALLKEKGFGEVYQLDGGVINYGIEEGKTYWKGKLFVFDDRLAIDIDGGESTPIAHCTHCHCLSDTYYNCANMDCNHLFISCPTCHEIYQRCCSFSCTKAPHLRKFTDTIGNKPFRKKHTLLSCV